MKSQAVTLSFAEKVLVSIVKVFFSTLSKLNPHKFQAYFAKKINVTGLAFSQEVYTLAPADAGKSICRINNNRMKSGDGFLAKRGDLVKVFNPETSQFVIRYAQGAGDLRLRYNELALDYKSKQALGIKDGQESAIQVMPANKADREYFLMYQDNCTSSRSSRKLGWYFLIGCVLIAVISM